MTRGDGRADTTQATGRALSLRDLWRKARPREGDLFLDLVRDYEEYHAHVETGHPLRADLVASWVERGSRVLDAGCGDGLMAEMITKTRDAHVEGIDVAVAAVAKAQTRGISARVQDLDANPNLPEGFDYILLVEVLEHLRWPHRVLLEAVRRARRAVIVTMPNSGWFVYRLQMAFGHAPVQSFTHLHFWTVTDFVAFCHRLGLPSPEVRAVASARSLRRLLVTRWTNVFAQQVAYRLLGGAGGNGPRDRP